MKRFTDIILFLPRLLIRLIRGIVSFVMAVIRLYREWTPRIQKAIDLGKKGIKFGTMGMNFLKKQKEKKAAEAAKNPA